MGRKVEVVTTVVFIFAQLPASAAAQDMPRYKSRGLLPKGGRRIRRLISTL